MYLHYSYSIQDDEERKKAHQLERLKYYYAVAVTDSAETGDTLYKELDGQEYGETGVRVDLRWEFFWFFKPAFELNFWLRT